MVFEVFRRGSNNWNLTGDYFDDLEILATLDFIAFSNYAGTVASTESFRLNMLGDAGTVTGLQIFSTVNALDALSTNTITVRLEAVGTVLVLTIPDIVTGRHFVIGAVPYNQGDRITGQWVSDSVGALSVRSVGVFGRYN